MGIRSSLTIEKGMVVALWVGMATFVILHSIALIQGVGEETLPMFRKLWFVGLGLVAVLVAANRLL